MLGGTPPSMKASPSVQFSTIAQAMRAVLSGIPASLCCGEWRNGTYVHVQEGLAGAPWFRVSEGIASEAQWRKLLERSVGNRYY